MCIRDSRNTAAANQAAVLQKGLQQLGHKVLIVTGSTKATEIIFDRGMLCCPASKSNNFYRQSANKIYAHMLDYYICLLYTSIIDKVENN